MVLGHHPLPPRAHSHNGGSSPGVASPSPLPLSQGLKAVMRHDPPPPPLLERFRPAATLDLAGERFSELAVNGGLLAAPAEPVSMTSRRPVTSRSQLPPSAMTKTHRAIKCYHCRMCEQVTSHHILQLWSRNIFSRYSR